MDEIFSSLAFKTTYAADFQFKGLLPGRVDTPPPPAAKETTTSPATGATTYQSHFQKPLITTPPASHNREEEAPPVKPWPHDYRTTYRAHYNDPPPHRLQARGENRPRPEPVPAVLVPWRPTEYAEEYVTKTATPWTGTATEFPRTGPSLYGTDWKTTYQRDFPLDILHRKPQLAAIPVRRDL